MPIIRLVLLWSALIIGIPIGMTLIGLPEKMAVWVGTGMIFGAIAHISQSPYWQYLKNKELNPFSKHFGESSTPKPESPTLASPKLNTPIKRLGFLVLVLGVALCLLTFIIFEVQYSHRDFLDAMFNRPYNYWGYKISMLCGLLLASVGYICSFQYEHTLGKLAKWVRSGSA